MSKKYFPTNRVKSIYPRTHGSRTYYVLRVEDCGVDRLSEVEHSIIMNRLESLHNYHNCIGVIDLHREATKIMNGGAARILVDHMTKPVKSFRLPNVYEEVKVYLD